MAKKNFEINTLDKLFTQETLSTHNTPSTHNTHDTPKTQKYRYNLNIDGDLKQYIKERAWQKRTSITQYLNDLVRADMQAYFAECEAQGIDSKANWEDEE